jgi:hypothetical protein
MLLVTVPLVVWACHGTPITILDVVKAVSPSVLSIIVGVAVLMGVSRYTQSIDSVFLRLVAETAVLFGTYWVMLLFALNQSSTYLKLLRELRFWGDRAPNGRKAPADSLTEKVSVSV